MSIHHQIKKIRETKKIKQQSIATALGISQSSYADIENGTTKLKLEDLLKITQVFDIGLEELLGEELASYNVYYNNNNQNPTITNVSKNDFSQERKLWEQLLASQASLIEQLKAENNYLKKLVGEALPNLR
jgi:transcriptional regulator with XRE-family HTH domain